MKQPYITRALGMGAATKLDRKTLAHGQHPHAVAVLLAKQRHRAAVLSLVHRHKFGLHRAVLTNLLINNSFNGFNFIYRHRLGIGEVKAQPFGID